MEVKEILKKTTAVVLSLHGAAAYFYLCPIIKL